jgi:hypothetical protein
MIQPLKKTATQNGKGFLSLEKSELALEKLAKQALADIEAGLGRPIIFTGHDIKSG